MSDPTLYPAPPRDIPPDLTRASGAYRFQVFILVLSIGFFVLLYVGLVIGSAYLTYYSATHPFGERGKWNLFLNGAAVLFFGMLFLFLFKGLFKRRKQDYGTLVEVKPQEQPDLFGFIHQLCDELKAPRPAKVYVSPEVNAAVFYDTSLLNLVVPPKKHLLIGLGLVNTVNLTEFKAVLAHEFGHFSQKSLGLGTYVYVANQVLEDIIHGRDSWDDWVNWWCQIDIRLSFPAWGLKGAVWFLRKSLANLYRGITLAHLSVKRQQEFNADDMAVSAAGSDAIVHSLCRLDFASESLNTAARDLHTAADHELFTADLFFHQSAAADWLRQRRKDPKLGLPPEPAEGADPATFHVFDPAKGDDGIPPMWRTHPPNHERERNAKRHYLHVHTDERSPWLLFQGVEGFRRTVTERFYTHGLQRREPYRPADPAEVQRFIDAEHAEMTYDPRYYGLYDDRFLTPGPLPATVPEVRDADWPDEKITEFLRGWPVSDLENRMTEHMQRRTDLHLLGGLKSGEFTLKGKTFTIRGQEHTARDVNMLFDVVDKELADDYKSFGELDQRCFGAHFAAAQLRAERDALIFDWPRELLERYRFHVALQDLLRTLINDDNRMNSLMRYLQGKRELQSAEFQELVNVLREISQSLADCVEKATNLSSPALTNVPAGTSLRRLIWEKDSDLPRLEGAPTQIKFDWILDYLRKQNAAQDRLRRIHYKSLGNILALQEKIGKAWLESLPPEPAPAPELPSELMNLP
jgi:Zn-dependent protease with chaperone function